MSICSMPPIRCKDTSDDQLNAELVQSWRPELHGGQRDLATALEQRREFVIRKVLHQYKSVGLVVLTSPLFRTRSGCLAHWVELRTDEQNATYVPDLEYFVLNQTFGRSFHQPLEAEMFPGCHARLIVLANPNSGRIEWTVFLHHDALPQIIANSWLSLGDKPRYSFLRSQLVHLLAVQSRVRVSGLPKNQTNHTQPRVVSGRELALWSDMRVGLFHQLEFNVAMPFESRQMTSRQGYAVRVGIARDGQLVLAGLVRTW